MILFQDIYSYTYNLLNTSEYNDLNVYNSLNSSLYEILEEKNFLDFQLTLINEYGSLKYELFNPTMNKLVEESWLIRTGDELFIHIEIELDKQYYIYTYVPEIRRYIIYLIHYDCKDNSDILFNTTERNITKIDIINHRGEIVETIKDNITIQNISKLYL